MDKTFEKRLKSDNMSPFVVSKEFEYIFTMAPRSDLFTLLFCQRFKKGFTTLGMCDLQFVGVYYKQDGKIYFASGPLLACMGDDEDIASGTEDKLQEQLTKKVRDKVESIIQNDRSNLSISELTEYANIQSLKWYPCNGAVNQARKLVLEDNYKTPVYTCGYQAPNWADDADRLSYILDPDAYAGKEAAAYIASNQEKILLQLLCNDLLVKEYESIVSNPACSVYLVKKIISAVKNVNAKTVNVTILKNGTELTFKTRPTELVWDCGRSGTYSWREIVSAKERNLFISHFGRAEGYAPQEILRITYGRKVLYEAEK